MSTEKNNTNSTNHPFEAAYVATAAERAALKPNELLPVNLDIEAVLATVIGAMKKMKPFRAEIAANLPPVSLDALDKAEPYVYALAHAQSVFFAASSPTELLPELGQRATKYRDLLLSDARALAHRGLIDGKPLDELKGGTGYMNTARDLGVLVRLLRDGWSVVAPNSAVKPADLDEAEKTYEQVTIAYGERVKQSEHAAEVAEDRQRAFTLLLNTYDEIRRAAMYIRWDYNDADDFAPSLWAGRGGRGKGAAAGTAGTSAPNPKMPSSDIPRPNVSGTTGSAPNATSQGVPVGHPNSSPFTDN